MSFSLTSKNIEISAEGVLSAECKNVTGQYLYSTLDLNPYIGNIDGNFQWGSDKFALTSSNLSVSGSILSGKLKKNNGNTNDSTINLDDHIKNDEGHLKYQ